MPPRHVLPALLLVLAGIAASGLAVSHEALAAAEGEPAPLSPEARRGLAFAGLRCAECHAIDGRGISPNPESPSFADIANRPGVAPDTMEAFLRDSHNYPLAMNFAIDPAQIRDLARYITTLRRAGYHPDQ